MKPSPLYHYTKIEVAKIIIEKSQLIFSYHPKINDPFDLDKDIIYDPEDKDGSILCNVILNNPEVRNKKPNFIAAASSNKENFLKIINNALLNSGLKETVKKTPFICFSANKDIRLMWGHYGDGFKGVALEFSGDSFYKAERVEYKPYNLQPSVINAPRLIKLLLDNREELTSFGKDLLLKKHEDCGMKKNLD